MSAISGWPPPPRVSDAAICRFEENIELDATGGDADARLGALVVVVLHVDHGHERYEDDQGDVETHDGW
jgi:hypothetical protein